MTTKSSPSGRKIEGLNLVLGVLFILLGIVFAIGQFVDFNIMQVAWPVYVIAPGVLLFVLGMTIRNGAGEAVSALGMIGTAVGLLLFYQDISDHWESWAYAWALVAPTAVGVSQIFYGTFHGRTDLVRTGLRVAGVGLVIFLIGAFFFEFVIGFSGFQLGSLGVAILLILLGVGVILRPLIRGNRAQSVDSAQVDSAQVDSA